MNSNEASTLQVAQSWDQFPASRAGLFISILNRGSWLNQDEPIFTTKEPMLTFKENKGEKLFLSKIMTDNQNVDNKTHIIFHILWIMEIHSDVTRILAEK